MCSSLPTWFPARCVFGVPPVQREAEGLCRLQREDPGPLHAAGVGQVLARGLPEVRLLWLPPGPGGLHPLHPGEPHPLPQGLPEVTRTPLAGGSGLKEGKTCCSQVQSLQYIDSVKLDTAQGWKGRLTVDPLGIQVKGNSLIMLVSCESLSFTSRQKLNKESVQICHSHEDRCRHASSLFYQEFTKYNNACTITRWNNSFQLFPNGEYCENCLMSTKKEKLAGL